MQFNGIAIRPRRFFTIGLSNCGNGVGTKVEQLGTKIDVILFMPIMMYFPDIVANLYHSHV
jgi:hypothetical protein